MAMTIDEIAALTDEGLLCQIAEEASEIIQPVLKHKKFGPRPLAKGVQYNNVLDARTEFDQLALLMAEHARRFGWH